MQTKKPVPTPGRAIRPHGQGQYSSGSSTRESGVSMRYIDHQPCGKPDVMKLSEMPRPELRAGEVLIEVAYAGVNRPDVAQRAGSYPPPPDASPVLGLEVAGRIVQVAPDVTLWKEGDEVCALTPGGGYAEYCAAPAVHCLPLPKGLSLLEAASLPENYFTV